MKTHQVITNNCLAKVGVGAGDSIRKVLANINDDEVGGGLLGGAPQLSLPAPPALLALQDARVEESFGWAYTF